MAEQGRTIPDPGFAGDDGSTSVALAAALAAYDGPGGHEGVLAVLGVSRLIVPVVATLGESEVDAAGHTHDKSSDMSTVQMRGQDGRIAQIVFSSVAAMQQWNPDARPVPVRGDQLARSALYDGVEALLLDFRGPIPVVVETDDLHAIASSAVLAQVGDEQIWIRPPTG